MHYSYYGIMSAFAWGKGRCSASRVAFYTGVCSGGCSVILCDSHKMAAHNYKNQPKEDKAGETQAASGILLAERWKTNKHIHGLKKPHTVFMRCKLVIIAPTLLILLPVCSPLPVKSLM